MVVILDPADYDAWLECPMQRARELLKCYPAESMVAEVAPKT
jgi:putative SOS response-associated peptidase YedK